MDKKSGFDAGRKQSHYTYGSFTEQAAVPGGFGVDGGKSIQSRTNYKSRVGVSESDFFGQKPILVDATGRNSADQRANPRDDVSEELSVGFRPHPEVDESDNELVRNTSIGYLSDTNNR